MKLFNWRKIVLLSVSGLLVLIANTGAAKTLEAAETKAEEKPTYTKADYNKRVKENMAQQATLHKEMGLILSQNYYDFPSVVALVDDAINQLNVAKEAENKAKAAAEKEDWQNAILEAKKWQQSQDKAADISSRAKTSLEQQGAKQVIGSVTVPITEQAAPITEQAAPITEQAALDGETLYKKKACLACHGVDAKTPIKPNYPKLAGQNKEYAIAQIKDIRSGARENGESVAMAGLMQTVTVSDSEMEAIAGWLASLDAGLTSDITREAEGAKLYQSKGCVACHGADANTPIMPTYPKLAGQNEEYVITQMTDIKSGARHNGQSAVMKAVISVVSDAEIETIAQWLASLGDSGAPAGDETAAEPEEAKTTEPTVEDGIRWKMAYQSRSLTLHRQ